MTRRLRFILITLVLCALTITALIYAIDHKRTITKQVIYKGKIISIDDTSTEAGAPVIYRVDTDVGEVTVRLNQDAVTCDERALIMPTANVGDRVEFIGERDREGVIHICGPGTYIK